jgi:hypothetical protein
MMAGWGDCRWILMCISTEKIEQLSSVTSSANAKSALVAKGAQGFENGLISK